MGPERTLREAWEAHADEWTAWARHPGHDSYWRFHREAFFALLPAPGRLTLDVGSGEGRVARDLAALGHRVLAVEPSPTLSRRAAEAGGGLLGVLRADGAHLPFGDAVADLVVAFMSVQDMDDMQGAVREFGRVLRPGGRLCLAVEHPINSAGAFRGREPDAEFAIAGDYFQARRSMMTAERDGLRMTFDGYHWSLEDYFAALERTGLLTEALVEPRPRTGGRWDRVPLFLDLRAVRP
ncbi:MAG TPA: class I SAM-dependent methyltransferase [Terriglobales bacterium]|nr:class I SAM-dependent methyltransferase [Terriglobales bacterium]